MAAESHKLRRFSCSHCSTLCEVTIPPNDKKSVRFQMRCPKCATLNEYPSSMPPAADEAAAAGQKRKADESSSASAASAKKDKHAEPLAPPPKKAETHTSCSSLPLGFRFRLEVKGCGLEFRVIDGLLNLGGESPPHPPSIGLANRHAKTNLANPGVC